MEKSLLFVREKAKDNFIKDANEALKFVNKVFNEAQRIGFNKVDAWKIAGFAYNRPTPQTLEGQIKELIVSGAGNMEIGGVKLSFSKMLSLIEVPDITRINEMIEQFTEKRINTGVIPFEKIENDKNIEISPDWLTKQLESFSVYAMNEGQRNTFQAFTNLVNAINTLCAGNHQRQYFEALEMESLVVWRNNEFVVDTSPRNLERLFYLFDSAVETNRPKKNKELKFTGE